MKDERRRNDAEARLLIDTAEPFDNMVNIEDQVRLPVRAKEVDAVDEVIVPRESLEIFARYHWFHSIPLQPAAGLSIPALLDFEQKAADLNIEILATNLLFGVSNSRLSFLLSPMQAEMVAVVASLGVGNL